MGKGRDLNNSLQECSNNLVKDSSNEGKMNQRQQIWKIIGASILGTIIRKVIDWFWELFN